MEHELKVWPDFFPALLDGSKPFEVRRDDRGFSVGDVLWLREYSPGPDEYTGREIRRTVTYVLGGLQAAVFGLRNGFVALGLECADLAAERARADELRRACADVLGQDPETWPDHGNAPLAIAAALALAVTDRDRLKAAIEQAPHARDCASTAFALTPGGPSPLGYSCNCWKRAAPAQEGGR